MEGAGVTVETRLRTTALVSPLHVTLPFSQTSTQSPSLQLTETFRAKPLPQITKSTHSPQNQSLIIKHISSEESDINQKQIVLTIVGLKGLELESNLHDRNTNKKLHA